MIAVPEDQLRAAYARRVERSRMSGEPGAWPEPFEAAMAHPLFSRILMIEALHGEASRISFSRAHADNVPVRPLAHGGTFEHATARGAAAVGVEGFRYWWQDRD